MELDVTLNVNTASGGGDPGGGDLPAGSGSFTINYHPSNPRPNEAVFFWITNPTGFNNVTDIYRHLDVYADLDNAGATYDVGSGQSAATARGWAFSAYWPSGGNKTVTVYLTERGFAPVAQTVVIPVQSRTPSITYWIAPDGDHSTAAPADAQNVHLTSYSQISSPTYSGNVDIRWKRGTSINWSGGDTITLTGTSSDIIIEPYGTGDDPIVTFTNSTGWFASPLIRDAGVARLSVSGLDVRGGYSPITGSGTNCREVITVAEPTVEKTLSVIGVRCRGVKALLIGQGKEAPVDSYVNVLNCWCPSYADYVVGWFSGPNLGDMAGNDFRQHPLALLRDAKLGALPQGPDHTPIRRTQTQLVASRRNKRANTGGWSPLGVDRAIQPNERALPTKVSNWRVFAYENEEWGAGFIQIGDTNTSNTMTDTGVAVVDCNRFYGGRQVMTTESGGAGLVAMQGGALYCRNNFYYRANLYSVANQQNQMVRLTDSAGGANLSTGPYVIEFNTIISDRSDDSGGNNNFVVVSDANSGPAPEASHNVVRATNHDNGGTFADRSPLSPGDGFKPVTGSSAIDAVNAASADAPVRDIDGNIRKATTNLGAYDTSVAAITAVAAPVHTGGLTAFRNSNFNHAQIDDLGTGTGIDPYLIEWRCVQTGTKTNWADGSNRSFDITFSNLSGSRVTVRSNTV